jgi:hypothetical protein
MVLLEKMAGLGWFMENGDQRVRWKRCDVVSGCRSALESKLSGSWRRFTFWSQ